MTSRRDRQVPVVQAPLPENWARRIRDESRFHPAKRRVRGGGWNWPGDVLPDYPAMRDIDAGVLEGLLSRLTLQLQESQKQAAELSERIQRLEETVEGLTDRPHERLVELSDLGSGDFSLARPILVNVEEYEDETLARWPAVELTAQGVSEPEALFSLAQSIVELMDELREEDPESLGEAPKRWLALLSSVVLSKTSGG